MADEQFKRAMNEWVALKAQLASARKDLTVLNKREKELREFVTHHMKTNEIDTVKVKEKIKVNLKVKKTKGAITKDAILRGLRSYFSGDEVRVEGAFKAIQDSVQTKEKAAVSVTGLKDLLEGA
jgi:2,3-bisphosphoglycerate-independent phosphoglycerate mutase